ncbi:hypothetical protein CEXT_158391 [Caerostris extrusa]|uniref:Uncharacterized protein n=1 Tax=Caerostris extrusa TaxID=172846 RepID=A0AAV4Y9M7_CAEEX|nr:hypothetical protein CEXT_158391 [Caerostris extrusa]
MISSESLEKPYSQFLCEKEALSAKKSQEVEKWLQLKFQPSVVNGVGNFLVSRRRRAIQPRIFPGNWNISIHIQAVPELGMLGFPGKDKDNIRKVEFSSVAHSIHFPVPFGIAWDKNVFLFLECSS